MAQATRSTSDIPQSTADTSQRTTDPTNLAQVTATYLQRSEELPAEDRRSIYNTLLCLLDGLSEIEISVELKNECSVTGTLDRLDKAMALCMSNVTFYDMFDQATEFDTFRVQGKRIRYVQIPDDVDIVKTMERTLVDRRRRHGRMNSGRVPRGAKTRGGRGTRARGAYVTDRQGAKERFREWFEKQHGKPVGIEKSDSA